MYKEFLEIANEMIPNIMRTLSGDQPTTGGVVTELAAATEHQQSTPDKLPLTSDPECYAMVLQFYDGLCEWEEGSSTPVLHITWAQHALYSLGRFDFKARAGLTLKNATADDNDDGDDSNSDVSAVSSSHSGGKLKPTADSMPRGSQTADHKPSETVSAVDDGSQPLPDTNVNQVSESGGSPVAENVEDKPPELAVSEKSPPQPVEVTESAISAGAADNTDTIRASLVLRSVKMMGMKDLLVAERLNSGAIKLQLTAQSQVHLRHSRTAAAAEFTTSDSVPLSASRKRIRRE